TALGADLARVERTVPREPAYQGQPQYCLLVFGPAAETRVWLVRDGDVLYVDRKGTGDLTDKGNAVKCRRKKNVSEFRADVATRADAKPTRGRLVVTFSGPSASLRFQVQGRYTALVDAIPDGPLQFADRPGQAPIIHFNGPFTFALAGPETLARNDQDGA